MHIHIWLQCTTDIAVSYREYAALWNEDAHSNFQHRQDQEKCDNKSDDIPQPTENPFFHCREGCICRSGQMMKRRGRFFGIERTNVSKYDAYFCRLTFVTFSSSVFSCIASSCSFKLFFPSRALTNFFTAM